MVPMTHIASRVDWVGAWRPWNCKLWMVLEPETGHRLPYLFREKLGVLHAARSLSSKKAVASWPRRKVRAVATLFSAENRPVSLVIIRTRTGAVAQVSKGGAATTFTTTKDDTVYHVSLIDKETGACRLTDDKGYFVDRLYVHCQGFLIPSDRPLRPAHCTARTIATWKTQGTKIGRYMRLVSKPASVASVQEVVVLVVPVESMESLYRGRWFQEIDVKGDVESSLFYVRNDRLLLKLPAILRCGGQEYCVQLPISHEGHPVFQKTTSDGRPLPEWFFVNHSEHEPVEPAQPPFR